MVKKLFQLFCKAHNLQIQNQPDFIKVRNKVIHFEDKILSCDKTNHRDVFVRYKIHPQKPLCMHSHLIIDIPPIIKFGEIELLFDPYLNLYTHNYGFGYGYDSGIEIQPQDVVSSPFLL